MFRYFLCWFPMLVLAIINGAARDLWYKERIGDLGAHQLSTITLILLFAVYIWFVVRKLLPSSKMQSLQIGFMWLCLTLLFEFGFGLARGNSFSKLLSNYNLFKGRIWILIPIWITVAPYFFFNYQKTKETE